MKLLFKLLIFMCVLFSGLSFIFPSPTLAASKVSVPILYYHYIGNNPNPADKARYGLSVPPDVFETQMAYLSTHSFTPISLDTLAAIYNGVQPAPAKPVVLTFDDGYIDFYLNAFPILKKNNFTSTVFIPTGLVGGSYYMNWDQIKELQNSGLVAVESHGVSHKSLAGLPYDTMVEELKTSKTAIESHTGYPVHFIAFPLGSTSSNVSKALSKEGYIGGLGTWRERASAITLNMPRLKVSGQSGLGNLPQLVGQ